MKKAIFQNEMQFKIEQRRATARVHPEQKPLSGGQPKGTGPLSRLEL
jgi:hypothetical protein